MTPADSLTCTLSAWCEAQSLPFASADEIDRTNLTDTQCEWLDAFVALWDLTQEADPVWWSCGSGYCELRITKADARTGSHPGQCDSDIAALRKVPYIAKQLAALDPERVRKTVAEMFGDATPQELADADSNLDRLLWIACGDIAEGNV